MWTQCPPLGWVGHCWRKRLGLCCCGHRGALWESSVFFALLAAGDWAVPLSSCSYSCAHGQGTAVGPLLTGLWGAIAPLMKPWCAEGEVPAAANLNLYRGRNSHVGWHSDSEPLFVERGETKLIVSVSFGARRSSNGRVSPVQTNDGNSCWLDDGDILVMDGQCRYEFHHCTAVGSNNMLHPVLLLKTDVICCLPTCSQGLSAPVSEMVEEWQFGDFLVSPWCLVHTGCASFASLPLCVYGAWVPKVCLLLDTPCGRRSVEALSL